MELPCCFHKTHHIKSREPSFKNTCRSIIEFWVNFDTFWPLLSFQYHSWRNSKIIRIIPCKSADQNFQTPKKNPGDRQRKDGRRWKQNAWSNTNMGSGYCHFQFNRSFNSHRACSPSISKGNQYTLMHTSLFSNSKDEHGLILSKLNQYFNKKRRKPLIKALDRIKSGNVIWSEQNCDHHDQS